MDFLVFMTVFLFGFLGFAFLITSCLQTDFSAFILGGVMLIIAAVIYPSNDRCTEAYGPNAIYKNNVCYVPATQQVTK